MLDRIPELVEAFHRPLLQGSALGLFLIAGVAWPRVSGQRLVNPDLLKNLLNGLLLFVFSVVAIKQIESRIEVGLFDLSDQAWLLQFLVAFCCWTFPLLAALHGPSGSILVEFPPSPPFAEVLDASTGLRMHVVDLCNWPSSPF